MSDPRSTVLVVEDDPDQVALIRASFRRYLRSMDIHVLGTGEAALDYLLGRSHPEGSVGPGPDVVLLDLGLPGMSGLDVLAETRGTAAASVPMVVFTSSENPEHRRRALELGAADYMLKPADPTKLVDAIRPYLAHGPGTRSGREDLSAG